MTKWIPSLLTIATLAAVPAFAQTPAVPAANPLQGNADAIQVGMGSSAPAAPIATAWMRAASARRTSRRSGRRAAPTTACSRRCATACPAPRCRQSGRARSTTKSGRSWRICAPSPRRCRPMRRRATPKTASGSFAPTAPAATASTAAAAGLDPISRASASRARARVMVRRIRGAVEDFPSGYEPVTVTPRTARRFTA